MSKEQTERIVEDVRVRIMHYKETCVVLGESTDVLGAIDQGLLLFDREKEYVEDRTGLRKLHDTYLKLAKEKLPAETAAARQEVFEELADIVSEAAVRAERAGARGV